MSNTLYAHDFQVDLDSNTDNQYCSNDIQNTYINDINQGTYSSGFINFTNLNLVGNSIDKMFSFSNAYITIPYTIQLTASGTNFAFKVDPSNAYSASLKGAHTIIDWISLKFDTSQLSHNMYHNHLMMNEKIKTYNTDKYKIYGDIMGHQWDNGYSINLSTGLSGLGEVNNNIKAPTSNITIGSKPDTMVNNGHVLRCQKNNIDCTLPANSSLNKFLSLSTNTTPNGTLKETENQSCLVYQDTTNIIFHGMATIPLSQLHNSFEKMPALGSVKGFELRLQTNLARENTYVMNYGDLAITVTSATPTSIVSNQSIGHCCPVMVMSNIDENGASGIAFTKAAITAGVITTRCSIGWYGNGSNTSSAPACRLYIPMVSYTSAYMKDIIAHPMYSLKYNDYYIDIDEKKTQGSTITKLFNSTVSKARILYIIPFLSSQAAVYNGGNLATAAYPSSVLSPLTSAPITATPCRLKNFQITVGGGQPIFSEPQAYNHSFYNSNAMSIISDVNGNSPKSAIFASQVSKSQWENGYNVFYVNLEKVSDYVTDTMAKSFIITFAIEGTNTAIAYDFYYMLSYENEFNIERLSGSFTSVVQ